MAHPRVTWLLAWLLTRLLVRVRVRGRAQLPNPAVGPVVVACRHLSWIDPMVIIAELGPQRPVVFLAAREHVERRPILDRLLTWLGVVIKVERESNRQREILRAAGETLKGGGNLALFPEGKINHLAETGRVLLPLEPGAAVFARRGNVALLPMAIAGSDDLYLGRRVHLAIGAPLDPAPGHRADEATTSRLHEAILAIIPPTPRHSRLQLGRWLGRLA